jgi:DNA polymerase-3 subunit delta'
MSNINGRADIAPWHAKAWQQLCAAKQKQHLPHAILMLGSCDAGKELFARAFAHVMLCRHSSADGDVCGQCHACHLLQAGSHPDLVMIAAEQPGQMIKVDQIREVVHFVNETSMQNGYRVIIINRAHNMNHNAANSLLKTLEEPAANTLFILLSGQGQRLQATITSRCQKLILPKPEHGMALQWLQTQLPADHGYSAEKLEIALNLAEGSPKKALSVLTDELFSFRQVFYQGLFDLSQAQADPLQLAAQWHERDLPSLFGLLFHWLQDLLKLQVTEGAATIMNADFKSTFIKLTNKLSQQKLLAYLTQVQNRYSKIMGSLNLNRQLLLEELFIRWTLINR